MFIDEAKIAVQLQHANIAQIFDLGEVDDSYFIALEYVHGRDLRSIFDRCAAGASRCPSRMACFVVMQVCEGLDYAHNKRDGQGRELHLVHRDVSPQNVLVAYEGEVKLIDFGIAKAAGKASQDPGGHPQGQVRLHVARAGARAADRSPQRHLRVRHRALRAAHRRAAVRRRERLLDAREGAQRRDPAAVHVQPKIPRRARAHRAQGAGEGSRGPLPERDRSPRRAAGVRLHRRRVLLAQGSRGVDEEDVRRARSRKRPRSSSSTASSRRRSRRRRRGLPARRRRRRARRRRRLAGASATASAAGQGARPPPRSARRRSTPWAGTTKSSTPRSSTRKDRDRRPLEADDLFFEDEDRTVANEPPPDMLEQARPPDSLVTPKPVPISLTPEPSEEIVLTPAPAKLTPPPAGQRAQVDAGRASVSRRQLRPGRAGTWPLACRCRRRRPAGAAEPGRRSRAPAVGAQPAARAARDRADRAASTRPRSGSRARRRRTPAPFGPGRSSSPRRRRRAATDAASLRALVLRQLVVICGTGYWYYSTINRPGRIELSTVPADATVLIDNAKVGDQSPVSIEKPPGRTRCRSRATATSATIRTSSSTPGSRWRSP